MTPAAAATSSAAKKIKNARRFPLRAGGAGGGAGERGAAAAPGAPTFGAVLMDGSPSADPEARSRLRLAPARTSTAPDQAPAGPIHSRFRHWQPAPAPVPLPQSCPPRD